MKPLKYMVAAAILLATTACNSKPPQPSGHYQDDDATFGIHFINERRAIVATDDAAGREVNKESYRIQQGKNGYELLLSGFPENRVYGIKQSGDELVLTSPENQKFALERVDAITIQEQTGTTQTSLERSTSDYQLEGMTNVHSINRAQQLHYVDDSKFANDLVDLGLQIETETDLYRHTTTAFERFAISTAEAKGDFNSYLGTVRIVGEWTTATLCEADSSVSIADLVAAQVQQLSENPTAQTSCPAGSRHRH